MPNCPTPQLTFPCFDRRKIEANFHGGDVSSGGGILLLREADRRLGLIEALDVVLPDPRNPELITHRQADLGWRSGMRISMITESIGRL
jgi:hypothetical protein